VRFEPLVRRLVGEAVELEVNLCPGLWPCKIDAAQLEAALLNLAANARDAMPDGGKLTIETRNSESDSKVETRVAGAGPGPYVVITVRDTGCGMSPEVVAHAFEPFFTTKEVGKGSGLGLSQAYGFVKQSGGHVTIDTEVGAGTLISLYLPPTNSASAVTVLTAATQSAEPARGSERILVVEDNADVLRTVTEMLKDLGYAVRGALGPQKALEVLQSNKRIDLLFSDMVLPHMGGRRLIEEARRLRPNLKVLLTSGYSRERVSHSASMDEGMSVIAKPYKKAELAARLRAVLDS
jgi:CheY-like chemotaxis protein